ncbi:MAG: PAS domain S-box protein, partial [Dehalococcoidia bacterium]|nr:PAS domain S-box protein [Dehalococcoidia bacterium]
ITERKRTEQKLKLTQFAIDRASIGCWWIDSEGRVFYVNDQACQPLGYTPEEMIGMTAQDFDPDFNIDTGKLPSTQELLAMKSSTFESRHRRKDGSTIPVEITVNFAEFDGKLHVFCFSRDITERKRAEAALQGSEERFRALAENSTDTIMRFDRQYRHLYANPVVEKIIGIPPKEFIGKTHQELGFPGDMCLLWKDAIEQVFQSRDARRHEFQLDGRWYDWMLVPEFDALGQTKAVIASARDITERKQAEEKIQASLQEKEVLLKEIHHRVKNNLQIISSLLNLQKETVKDEDSRAMLEDSGRRVRSMALIHEQLYRSGNLARIDFTNYIRELCRNLLHSHNGRTQAIGLDIRGDGIFLGIDTAVPCGLMINELVTNSLKYAFPKGWQNACGEDVWPGIKIELMTDSHELTLRVADNGIGLPEEIDYRNTETLGLQLVTSLANQLGATLEVERQNGTTFQITFLP